MEHFWKYHNFIQNLAYFRIWYVKKIVLDHSSFKSETLRFIGVCKYA